MLTQILPACQTTSFASGLYILSTPIGNLRDITLRALDVMTAADHILCEDTRVTYKLLHSYGLVCKAKLHSYNEHNAKKMHSTVMTWLQDGLVVALVSDAGTPAISDPGERLIAGAIAEQCSVIPVPGASSVLAALVASGLPTGQFQFCGFLPRTSSARQEFAQRIAGSDLTFIAFERPNRLLGVLQDMQPIIPYVQITIAREITKMYEQFWRGTILEALEFLVDSEAFPTKGEAVILFHQLPVKDKSAVTIKPELKKMLQGCLQVMSVRETVSVVGSILDLPKKQLYDWVLSVKAEGEQP